MAKPLSPKELLERIRNNPELKQRILKELEILLKMPTRCHICGRFMGMFGCSNKKHY